MKRITNLLMALTLLPLPAAAQGRAPSAGQKLPAQKKAQELPPPAFTLELNNEVAEAAWRPRLTTSELPGVTLTPSFRAGMLALSQSMTVPYAILLPSPYLSGGASLVYSGALEFAAMGNLSAASIESKKYFSDPTGSAASSASGAPTQDRFSAKTQGVSGYADLGKIVSLGSHVKGAFFAGAGSWTLLPQNGGYGAVMEEYNLGTMWSVRGGKTGVTVYGDVAVEPARTKFYRNAAAEYEWVPSQTAGAELTHDLAAGELRVGVEGSNSRADTALRPYAGFRTGKIDTLAAGNIRQSNDKFYPDVRGAGLSVDAEVAQGLRLGVTGSVNNEMYQMAPAPITNTALSVGLTFRLDDDAVIKSAVLYKQAHTRSAYQPSHSQALNNRLPGSTYSATTFRNAMLASATFQDFVKNINVKGTDQALAALSAMSEALGTFNYNHDESTAKPNLENVNDIYKRARAAFLNKRQDPILVCMGEAQFTAFMANELARQGGVQLQGAAVTVSVPGEGGKAGGHAVAMIKTHEYGIVFVDWGQLTPTQTFSTKQALRIYQALQGIPNVYHIVTDADRDGRHVGYLFTEEGKMMVKRLTYHGDAKHGELNKVFDDEARTEQVTVQRYKELLRKAFDQ